MFNELELQNLLIATNLYKCKLEKTIPYLLEDTELIEEQRKYFKSKLQRIQLLVNKLENINE